MDRQALIAQVENLLLGNENIIPAEGFSKWFLDTIAHWRQTDFSFEMSFRRMEGNDHISAWAVGNNSALEYIFFDVFCHQIFSAFLKALESQCFEDCRIILSTCNECLVDFRNVNENSRYNNKEDEHLDGAEFILQSLTVFCQLVCAPNDFQWKEKMRILKPFNQFNSKAQAFVFAVKSRFLRITRTKESEMEAIDQCLELDPNHWEWNIEKFKKIRWARRNSFEIRSVFPEKEFVEKAYTENPDHPLCIFRVCQWLGELLRARRNPSVDLGANKFQNAEEILQFLTEKSTQFKADFPDYSGWIYEFAKLFSSDLPFELRNRPLARTFLEQAIAVTPESSKINHRFGIFLTQEKDFDAAMEYLEKACEYSPTNKPALHDLVDLYMKNFEHYQEKLNVIFENFIPTSHDWASPQILSNKGRFYFLTNDKASAVDAWVQLANDPRWHACLRRSFKNLSVRNAGIEGSWRQPSSDAVERAIESNKTRLDPKVYNLLLSEYSSVIGSSNTQVRGRPYDSWRQ